MKTLPLLQLDTVISSEGRATPSSQLIDAQTSHAHSLIDSRVHPSGSPSVELRSDSSPSIDKAREKALYPNRVILTSAYTLLLVKF